MILFERARYVALIVSITLPGALLAAGGVDGEAVVHEAPGGMQETCVAIEPVPGGNYKNADRAQEQALCAIDFYAGDHALCPKTFSTSPGTLIYPLAGGSYAGRAEAFEAEHCAEKRIVRSGVTGEPVSFKMTMNGPDTSATFAPASLLYYHFARYFDTYVDVPASVWRSMDRQAHFERVVRRGVEVSSGDGSSAMNRSGWETLARGARDPATYRPTAELYTDGNQQIFGILLQEEGRRYGAEINGTRRSGWGAGQNRDFQETAPFLALRHDGPLLEAIAKGIDKAMQDPDLRKAMGSDPTTAQMSFWMVELTEIVLLDFIFSQQDRVGNIDYVDYWYWAQEGVVQRRRATGHTPPNELAGYRPEKIRRSIINDNDAGGRVPYVNYAKKTEMLNKLRHLRPETYRRLQRMVADFKQDGPLHKWLATSFGISDRQVRQIVENATTAEQILGAACRSGQLRFSLDPHAILLHGTAQDEDVPCSLEQTLEPASR